MPVVLFDNIDRKKLYPLSNTCALADIRTGIYTAKERWGQVSGQTVYVHTEDYLSILYDPVPYETHWWADAAVLAGADLIQRILSLKENEAIADSNGLIAYKKLCRYKHIPNEGLLSTFEKVHTCEDVKRLGHAWDIFEYNDEMLRSDFAIITKGRLSQTLPENNQYAAPGNIFLEPGVKIDFSIINAFGGPVYIGRNAVIMEGSMIRGPFAVCNDAIVKMGAKIYGPTTLGPCCVAGGEIKNTVMQGWSNKAHDGYLGDAVVGHWCNMGAGTTNSNVKNTAGMVKMWSAAASDYVEARMKCGMVMGDYSRTAINSSINTGTVIGTCCNIFGDGLLPKYIPDFQWGAKGNTRYEFEKSIKDIDNWKKMKGRSLSAAEKKVLQYIFETT